MRISCVWRDGERKGLPFLCIVEGFRCRMMEGEELFDGFFEGFLCVTCMVFYRSFGRSKLESKGVFVC